MQKLQGILMKSIGGFYYVRSEDKEYECKARGSFRKKGSSPVAGDRVEISVPDEGYCAIEQILPRKNKLKRPALANIDALVIVCSTVDPQPNFTVIDKMTAAAVNNGMTPVLAVSKNDIKNGDEVCEIYRKSGIKVFQCSPDDKSETDALRDYLKGKVSAFTGNSGVGKSTLLNMLFPSLELATGQISEKLGRGRHTTRVVELFELDGCFVADTPGFSTVDLQRYEMIDKEQLQYCFPEFEKYLGQCRFTSCAHTCEKGCKILEAVQNGEIAESRHKSYVQMYNEVKDIKHWQLK
ncbi:ribosome small subunit-dependent GTPase A [Ruminococcus sp. JL13D9]|uniref:ribosome small subunit-dependent GTPase A n=1 Tax=Ruminococcus sp. JL13D9 TaxID=3233381 RepID=UPI00389B00D8